MAQQQQRREVSSMRRPTRYSRMLMQVYFNWGKFEWALRNYGAARHLFRSAADETNKHAEGMNEGGGGKVLHYWAAQVCAVSIPGGFVVWPCWCSTVEQVV